MSHQQRSPIQDDEDLSKLYNAVLAGFATENEGSESLPRPPISGTPGDSNILSVYDPYRADATQPDTSRPSQNGYATHAPPPRAGTSAHAMSSRPSLPTSPRRANRPLPQPPTTQPGPSAGPSRVPETHPYYPDEKRQPLARSVSRQLPPSPSAVDVQHTPRSTSYNAPPPPPPSQRPGPPDIHRSVTAPGTYAQTHSHRPPGAAPPTPPVPNGHPALMTSPASMNGSYDYVLSSGSPNSSPVVPLPRQSSRSGTGAGEASHHYQSSSVSSGRYGSEGPSPEVTLKSVHSISRSVLERNGGFEGRGYDVPPGAERSSSSSSYSYDNTASTTTPATTIERGNSLSSSIYAPVSSSSHEQQHQPSIPVSSYAVDPGHNHGESSRMAESSRAARHAEEMQRTIASIKAPLELHDDEEEEFDDIDDEEDDPDRFVTLSLLSHLAVRLRDKVPRGTHVKGSIPYDRAFTGKDIVSTIQSQIQRELLVNMGISTSDRRTALGVARSLQSQLFFYEVEWGGRQLSDGVEDVFMFLDDAELSPEREELPTGVITVLTKCYSSTCHADNPCYAFCCPRRASNHVLPSEPQVEPQQGPRLDEWKVQVDSEVLRSLPQSEVRRQMVIRKVIEKEEQYVQDLDIIESLFIKPLRKNNPEVIPQAELDDFIDAVFGNVLDLRECNRRLLETMYVRQREQAPIIQRIGDIFLTAAVEFRLPYPNYVGHLPLAEKRMKDEIERNSEFRRFVELCARNPDARRFDLRHFITRPSEHLQRYPVLLEAIFKDTAEGNPDAEFLQEAIQAIRKLSGVAHVRTFQSAMLRGPTAKLEWHDLVSAEVRESMNKHEVSRQGQIFELIKGEMEYVKDLENLNTIFIQPLKALNPPIIPRDRLPQFIDDVFYNFADIHKHHRRMLDRLHEIQREEHPVIYSITATIFDAALNWRDAYMDFIPHYPIAAYRVDDEIANNLPFKTFVEQCTRNPDARKLDIKAFIYRPIPRLLRYELLLKAIMGASPAHHEDKETIPQVLEIIKALGKESEPGVMTAKQKVELWKYNANLVFKPGEAVDMDLLADTRTLVHTGKLLRQPDTGFEWNGWSELFVLLFDNYLVLTKTKDKGEVTTKYHVNRHPIPLDLLSLANFTDPPQQRGAGILRGLRGGERHATDGAAPGPVANTESTADPRTVFPCTIHHTGRLGGLYTLYTESAQARIEWKQKLEEALALRKAVTENNKVFEVETLSSDTFLVPSLQGASSAAWNQETVLTGKVTCSVPFSTADGMRLVAIGCAEGVWIGLRHDSKSMRRVLHLKMVTQCAMLEDFGIFLVLADKSLWAYHIEALVPSSPPRPNTNRAPQKLNNHKDVQFFSVGTLNGRTLLIYMKKKALDSVFHVLEPVVGKIAEKPKAPGTFGRSLFGSQRSDWFRPYKEFFLPSEAFDLIFLKGKIAVLCTKGFEIMDLTDLKSVTIPQKDDQRLATLAKRCETSRPLGMFRSSENEFLLCYDDFGLYVDRYGDPSRPGIGLIEWEGTAERVACHPPYVLLFDSRFIEVRHIETGRLAQVIQGADVRCIWDGRGSSTPPITTPGPNGWQENPSQEARVHAVMRAPEHPRQPGSRAPVLAQQVIELVPTIPLYLPGALSSPEPPSTYFPSGQSPPRSPRLQSQRTWR